MVFECNEIEISLPIQHKLHIYTIINNYLFTPSVYLLPIRFGVLHKNITPNYELRFNAILIAPESD